MSQINMEVMIKIGYGGIVTEHFWELGVVLSHSEGHGKRRTYDALAFNDIDSVHQ